MRSRLSTQTAASVAAIVLFAAQATAVHAGNILNFGLNNSASITATETGGISTSVTTTPIAGGGGQPVTITLLNGTADSISAYLDLSATSVGPATSFHGSLYQNFDGSFTITANANGTGTNYLSGTFTNVAFDSQLSGLIGGTGATLTASDPTATITFTSSVITALDPPSTSTFIFSDLSPSLSLVGATISGFTASGSGTFSANLVPEPLACVLAGVGAIGMIGCGLLRRKALGI